MLIWGSVQGELMRGDTRMKETIIDTRIITVIDQDHPVMAAETRKRLILVVREEVTIQIITYQITDQDQGVEAEIDINKHN